MSGRVLIMVSAELGEKLERCADGGRTTVDEIVEAALAGDPDEWIVKQEDVQPSAVQPKQLASSSDLPMTLRCSCCAPYACQHLFQWRGTVRCGCDGGGGIRVGGGRPFGSGTRVVQPDLERE